MITITINVDIADIRGLSILFIGKTFFDIDEFISEYKQPDAWDRSSQPN